MQNVAKEGEMELKTEGKIIDWNHVYLLGWYGRDGQPYLTTWSDSEETRDNYITIVVTGPEVQTWGPPLWNAPANCKPNRYGFPSHHYNEYQLHELKPDEMTEEVIGGKIIRQPKTAQEKAIELGGVKALGWYIKRGFVRQWDK